MTTSATSRENPELCAPRGSRDGGALPSTVHCITPSVSTAALQATVAILLVMVIYLCWVVMLHSAQLHAVGDALARLEREASCATGGRGK